MTTTSTLPYDGDTPLIPMPPLKLAALREAIAKLAPQRLAEMDAERDAAFDQAAEDGTDPLRLFLKK